MVGALGAVTGFDDWAPTLLQEASSDALRAELIAVDPPNPRPGSRDLRGRMSERTEQAAAAAPRTDLATRRPGPRGRS